MAAANYDEVVHSAGNVVTDWSSIDPLYKWDTHFPERLSRLSVNPEFSGGGTPQRRQKRGRNRNTSRFKTQPITFDEIKEVDEEPGNTEDRKEGLKSQFAAFSRSMDGLVPGFPVLPPCLRKAVGAAGAAGSAGKLPSCGGLLRHHHHPHHPHHPEMPTPPPPTTTTAATTMAAGASHLPPLPSAPPASCATEALPAALVGGGGGGQAAAAGRTEQQQQEDQDAAVFAAVGLNPTLAQVQDVSRARRNKKRRSRKSIEEEPELERSAAVESNSAG